MTTSSSSGLERPGASEAVGYYGQPALKPPVWTWEVPLYFFVGGLAGMAALLGAGALLIGRDAALARTALWTASVGSVLSAALLVSDLGRSSRFLYMLRVFKPRSAMSVGAWTLALFGLASTAAAALATWSDGAGGLAGVLAVLAAAPLGALLATYTGVLLGATAIPAWSSHRSLLPVHFGAAGLGSAASLLFLLHGPVPALRLIGLGAAAVECVIGAAVELDRHGARDRALRRGRAAKMLRGAGVAAGPAALALWVVGPAYLGALLFLAGALLSRFGWLAAGRASALDPEAALAPPGRAAG
jgi:hypothetical protein